MQNRSTRLASVSLICAILAIYAIFLNTSSFFRMNNPSSDEFRSLRREADGFGDVADGSDSDHAISEAQTSRRFAVLSSESNRTIIEKVLTEFAPPLRMEQARRHVAQTSRDLGNFIRHQLNRLLRIYQMDSTSSTSIATQHDKTVAYIVDNLAEYQRVVEDQLQVISDNDGWKKWREKEARLLQDIVQNRLYAQQNPKNCSEDPILLCSLTNFYGFASGVHDVLWCFIEAYYTERRMVLVTSAWHYAPSGWETFFKPLSDNCLYFEKSETQNITLGPGDNNGRARYLLSVLPKDLGPRIVRMHGNPLAWWYGQFLLYLFRPNSQLKTLLDDVKHKSEFKNFIVGIQVRRSDKIGSEAKSHELIEYMRHVEDYFKGQELIYSDVIRKVYIATDDPDVIKECEKKFPQYACMYIPGSAKLASNIVTRYSNASRWNVLVDVFMLANTDFLVCTLSSGVCRLAYELMQAMHFDDASKKVVSLDVQYHYAYVSPPKRRAIYNHKANSVGELNFKKGDEFCKKNEYAIPDDAIKGKTANGLDELYETKLKIKVGLVPTYKTNEIFTFCNSRCHPNKR